MQQLPDLLAYFATQHSRDIDSGLDRILKLLEHLGNPHHHLPPIIHAAGTNGKGSVLAFTKSLLEAAGKVTHRYTSPHLISFQERIEIKGTPISDEKLAEYLQKIEEVHKTANLPISFFEATTAAAFLAFGGARANYGLLETGLGGRLDATNVIDKPALAVIMPIDFDHTEFLGRTLEKIAREKAGIIKENSPLVIGPQHAEVYGYLTRYPCKSIFQYDKDWHVTVAEDHFVYEGMKTYQCPLPSLQGTHQIYNAATAIACLEVLGEEIIPNALTTTIWPARFEHLAELSTESMDVYLDGSHNVSGAKALAETLKQWPAEDVILMVACKEGKDINEYLKILDPICSEMIFPENPESYNKAPAAYLLETARNLGIESRTINSVWAALDQIKAEKNRSPKIVTICGSLYFAGEIKRELEKNRK